VIARLPVQSTPMIRSVRLNAQAELPWTAADAVPLAARPVALWSWLTDSGSLTQRLREHAGTSFRLHVLAEQREPLRHNDATRMQVAADQQALIREVRLDADGQAAIHAVTVIPASTLDQHPELATLGARPLGEALFERADVARAPFEVACLGPSHPLAARALAAAGQERARLWARRSVVRVAGQPLLIHECFLFPAIAGTS
jgi:chorismate--pyruvate lyase